MRKQRKRMSERAIAAMKRENRTLRERLNQFARADGTSIAQGTICESATSAILTAHRLGYLTVVCQDWATVGNALRVVAIKRNV